MRDFKLGQRVRHVFSSRVLKIVGLKHELSKDEGSISTTCKVKDEANYIQWLSSTDFVELPRLKVYVASSSKNILRVRALQKMIEEAGHWITLDWTREFDKPPIGRGPCEVRDLADADYAAVGEADVLVFVNTEEISAGAYAELGYASALKKEIVILAPSASFDRIFLFSSAVSIQVASAPAVIGYLDEIAARIKP